MQPSSVFTLLLLPLAILATPLPEAFPEAIPEPMPAGLNEEGDVSLPTVPSAADIFKRSYQTCRIIGASQVNCRTGPSTAYPAKWVVKKGGLYGFTCYESGECADGNCTWDRIVWDGNICYVNGHYTDNNCTPARLGKCA